MVAPGVSVWSTTSNDLKILNDLDGLKEPPQAERTALEKKVWRKLDFRTLPLCTCFFLLAALDKTNIANARLAGLQQSLAMSNYQFTVLLTVDFIPFLLAQLPCTLLLKYVGPDLMLPTMTVLWGVASASQGSVRNYAELMVCRIFLGFIEGGITPAIVLYLSIFYPRQRLQSRIVGFFASASLASAFSGLLAAAISGMEGTGNKPGWAWIFIIEGIISIVFGLISFFLVPRSPTSARFLTEEERVYVVSTLKDVGSVSADEIKDSFSWIEVGRAAMSLHVWFLGIISFLSGATVFGIVYFEPTIVASLGYVGNQAQLMSVPPFALTFVLSIISGVISDHYQCRGYNAMFFSLLQVIGFSVYYAGTSNRVRYASLFLFVPGAFGVAPALMTWMANNSAPHTRRATTVGSNFVLTNLGGILATWLLGTVSSPPLYTSATITFIVMSVGMVIASTVNWAYLRRENRLKAAKRRMMTKDEEPEGLGDRSAWYIYSL